MLSRDGALMITCMLAAAVLVVLHVAAFRQMSPVDEIQHLDYMLRVESGDLVHRGDLLLPETRRIVACRGFDPALSGMLASDWVEPICGDDALRPDQFPQLGFNTAWRHPPTYYVITAGLASIIELVPGVDDTLSAARLSGIAWAIGTVGVMWALFGAFGVARANRVLLVLFLVASPAVLFYLSVVTEDATAVAAGAGALLAVRVWQQGRALAWLPISVAGVTVALKWTNLAGVAAAAVFLIAAEVLGDRKRLRHALRVVLGMFGACVLTIGGWYVAQTALAKVPAEEIPLLEQQRADSLDIGRTIAQTRQLVTPLRIEYLPDALEHDGVYLLVLIADAALIAILVLRSLLRPKTIAAKKAPVSKKRAPTDEAARTAWIQPLALATGSTMLLGGIGFVLVGFIIFGVFNQVQPRFGLSLLPGAFVVLASVLRSPGGRIAVGPIAISTIALVALSLIAA